MFEHLVKMGRGSVTTAHDGISATATSATVQTNFHNAMFVSCNITGTGAWTVKLQGAITSDGTFIDLYDFNGSLMSLGSIPGNKGQVFAGLPEFIKIVATKDSGTATLTVKVQPITV